MDDSNLQVRITGDDSKLDGTLKHAEQGVKSFGTAAQGVGAGIAAGFADVLLSIKFVQEAIDAVFAGIKNADALRDLAASVEAVSTSTAEASKSLKFFEEAQKQTRSTGDDLAKFYAELLPVAIRKGFSEETFRTVTVQLDQFATAVGKKPEQIMQAWEQLMAGRARGTNPILEALGISTKDIQSGTVGIDELLPKIEQMAAKGEAMGDSMASAGAKIKDALLDAFGEGFNKARGDADKGMQGILHAIQSPAVQAAIQNLGGAVATLGPKILGAAQIAIGAVTALVGSILGSIAQLASKVLALMENLISFSGKVFGAVGFDAIAAGMKEATDNLRDLRAGLKGFASGEFDVAASGVNLITSAIESANDSELRLNLTTKKTTDQFDSLATAGKKAHAEIAKLTKINWSAMEKSELASVFSGVAAVDKATLEEFRRVHKEAEEGMARADAETLKVAREKFDLTVRAAEKAGQLFQQNFGEPVSQMFSDLATTGGRNFGQIAGAEFGRLVQDGAADFTTILATFFGGGTVTTDKNGQSFINGKPASQAQVQAANSRNEMMAAIAGYASIGIGSYQAGASGQHGAITGGILGGGMSGAAIGTGSGAIGVGTAVGAIVGAIVGGIAAALGKAAARDEYKFGIPGIDKFGNATLDHTKNINSAAAQQMLARIQSTYDEFRDGYVNLLLKIPGSIIPKIKAIDGQFQGEASAHFLEHFEQWITNTLPKQIADQFGESLGKAFESLGMSGDRFKEIMTKFSNLDPKKALELLNTLADTLINFNKVKTFFGSGSYKGADGKPSGGIDDMTLVNMGHVRDEMNQSFIHSTEDARQHMRELGAAIQEMTGEGQITSAHELSTLMVSYMEQQKTYLKELIQFQDQMTKQFQSFRRGLDVEQLTGPDGKPDPKAQLDYLNNYLNQLYGQIGSATNPQQLQSLMAEVMQTLQQMHGIAQSMGPDYLRQFDQWATDASLLFEKAFNEQTQKLADDLGKANAAFIDQMQPYIDAFTKGLTDTAGATNDAGDAAHHLRNGLDAAGDALDRFRNRLDNFDFGDGGNKQWISSVAARRYA